MHRNNDDIAAGEGGKIWLFYIQVRFKRPVVIGCGPAVSSHLFPIGSFRYRKRKVSSSSYLRSLCLKVSCGSLKGSRGGRKNNPPNFAISFNFVREEFFQYVLLNNAKIFLNCVEKNVLGITIILGNEQRKRLGNGIGNW